MTPYRHKRLATRKSVYVKGFQVARQRWTDISSNQNGSVGRLFPTSVKWTGTELISFMVSAEQYWAVMSSSNNEVEWLRMAEASGLSLFKSYGAPYQGAGASVARVLALFLSFEMTSR
jgi:hypothetical protein